MNANANRENDMSTTYEIHAYLNHDNNDCETLVVVSGPRPNAWSYPDDVNEAADALVARTGAVGCGVTIIDEIENAPCRGSANGCSCGAPGCVE
jgi:hypothetical protein